MPTIDIEDVRTLILTSKLADSLVQVLANNDKDVRGTAIELFKQLVEYRVSIRTQIYPTLTDSSHR